MVHLFGGNLNMGNIIFGGRRGCGRIVVGFTTTYAISVHHH